MAKLKKIGYGYVFLLFFVLSLTSASYRLEIDPPMENENNSLDKEELNPRSANYWNNIDFIHIDGNWSDASRDLPWVQGDGNWSNPFRIENVTIDASGLTSNNPLWIRNTNEYFIIKNCTILNCGHINGEDGGITLEWAHNGTITGCNFTDNYESIDINLSNNISIIDNDLIGKGIGTGINVRNCQDCKILNNRISNMEYRGLFLQQSSEHNQIRGNTISNTHRAGQGNGITIQDSHNNAIEQNTLKENDNGIAFTGSASFNNITGNEIEDNEKLGALAELNTQNNTFHSNQFNNPGSGVKNAVDNGTDNKWDNGEIGNYWHDYEGKDEDDDGIGDDPYAISGTANAIDNYPIWDDGDEKEEKDDTDDEVPAIPGFPFGFLMGIMSLSVLGLIILRKFKK